MKDQLGDYIPQPKSAENQPKISRKFSITLGRLRVFTNRKLPGNIPEIEKSKWLPALLEAKVSMASSTGTLETFEPILTHLVSKYANHKHRQRRFSEILQSNLRDQKTCHPRLAALLLRITGDELLGNVPPIRGPFSPAASDRIIAEHGQLFSDEAYDKNFNISRANLTSIITEMGDLIFKEKKHWGLVAVFLGLSGTLAAHCSVKKKMERGIVRDVISIATSQYLQRNLGDWIKENGGYVSINVDLIPLWPSHKVSFPFLSLCMFICISG